MFLIESFYRTTPVHPSNSVGRCILISINHFSAISSVLWAVSCKIYAGEIRPRGYVSAMCLVYDNIR